MLLQKKLAAICRGAAVIMPLELAEKLMLCVVEVQRMKSVLLYSLRDKEYIEREGAKHNTVWKKEVNISLKFWICKQCTDNLANPGHCTLSAVRLIDERD